MEIISEELRRRGLQPAPENADVVRRVIHATADFDFAETLTFTDGAVGLLREALKRGADIVTDTEMAKAGISRKSLLGFGGTAHCFMRDESVAKEAAERGVTRAWVSMERAAVLGGEPVFAIGNAPTALFRLCSLVREGRITPAGIIAVPVGFVNVVEAKELALEAGVPCIAARGRKGGSTVAAAIVNALLYGAGGRS